MEQLWLDLKHSLRALRNQPGFTVVAILTLALGIGANVTMLSIVDALLFRMPGGIRAPEQLVRISHEARPPRSYTTSNFQGYEAILENARSLDVALHMPSTQDFGRGAEAKQINVDFVTYNFFQLLSTEIRIGRTFTKDENQLKSAAPVAILTYQFWQQQFGGDPRAIGGEILIGERRYTVIGVSPRGFNGIYSDTISAWLPLADSPAGPEGVGTPATFLSSALFYAVGRLHDNVTPSIAAIEADALYLHAGGDPQFTIRVGPLFPSRTAHLSENARLSLWLSGVAFIVLLIACANITNLFLARVLRRSHEMAVRVQLGATRTRLFTQSMAESLLLAVLGGIAAVLVMAWSYPLVRSFLLPPGFFTSSLLNYRMAVVTVFLALLAGACSGIAPAWRASRPNLAEALQAGRHGSTRDRSTLRSTLLVAQVALTLILTIGAGLFIHSLRNIRALDLGFEPDRALMATVDLRKAGFQSADINAVYERLLERVKQVPDVEAAGVTSTAPLAGASFYVVNFPDDPSASASSAGSASEGISPGYFAALGMKIVQGRDFQSTDRVGAPAVMIINEGFAHAIWPGQNPLGKCIVIAHSKTCAIVIGVVRDMKPYLVHNPIMEDKHFFVPLAQSGTLPEVAANALLIRTQKKPSEALPGILFALQSAAPGARYVNLRPFSQLMDPQTRSWRLGASMFSFFGTLALVLAAVGIYGMLAFLVRQRIREIGVRMALGALPQNVLRLIIWQGMKLVGLGLALGIASALALTRLMRGLLFGVAPTDAASYFAASAILLVTGMLACLIPASRAARVDPIVALRHE